MADGRVEIDTRLQTGDIRRDVATVNREFDRMMRNIERSSMGAATGVSGNFDSMGRRIRRVYTGTSEAARQMHTEMRTAYMRQAESMRGLQDDMIGVQHGYFQLAQSSRDYQGTTEDFMAQVEALGAQQKKINDQMLAANEMGRMSLLMTVGAMMNMSTQASKISANYERMRNPLLMVNALGLRAADGLERLANSGNASVLALRMLGPTASMKQLNDMIALITQGQMRFQAVALASLVTAGLVYAGLHKAATDTVSGYEEALNKMGSTVRKAFQQMVDVFGMIMVPIYNFITAIAELIIKFNEAHPVIAKMVAGFLLLVPALTVILSPLAVGIGLFGGLKAAMAAIWPIIGPMVTGFAAMMGTVLLVSAAIVGLVSGINYLWKTNEKFRNGVMATIGAIGAFIQVLADLGKYLFWAAVGGDSMNDWLSHLPPSMQKIAQTVGEALTPIHKFGQAVVDLSKYLFWTVASGDSMNDWLSHLPSGLQATAQTMGVALSAVHGFAQALVDLGKYLFWVAASGDTLNDWLSHLPAGFQSVAIIIGQFVDTARTHLLAFAEAVKAAFNGDFSSLAQVFAQLAPMIIGFLLGGIPAIILAAAKYLPAIAQGITSSLPILVSTITNIINNLVTMFTTYLPMLVQVGIQMLTTIISGLTQALPLIVQSLVAIMTSLVTLISQTLTTLLPLLLNAGIQILMAIINGIVQNLPLIINAAIQLITQLANAIVVNLPLILNAGIQILMSLLNGIVTILPKLIDTAIKLIDTIIKTIASNLPKIIDSGIKVLMSLINGIIKILPKLIDTSIKLIDTIVKMLITNLPKIIDSGIKILMALIDGIVKILPKLIETALNLIVKIVTTLIANLPKIIESGVKILFALIDGIIKILPQLITLAIDLIIKVAATLIKNLPKIIEAGVKLLKALIEGIISVVSDLASSVKKDVMDTITNKLKELNLYDIGKNIIEGLISGIKSMIKNVTSAIEDVAGNIKDKITSALGIHSPSRWMRDFVGKMIPAGIAIGIRQNLGVLKQATMDMVRAVTPNLSPTQKMIKELNNSLLAASRKSAKDRLSIVENFISNKKQLEQLSATDEVKIWEAAVKKFKTGTEERRQAELKLRDSRIAVYNQLKAIDDEYTAKIQESSQKLIDGIAALNKAYEDAVNDRAKSLYSFAGLFDQVNKKEGVSGQGLIDNLRGQTGAMEEWANNIQDLADRGINEGLLAELRAMGPGASAEIAALNSLSDTQLAEFVGLWQTKTNLARTQAEKELAGMKADTAKKITELQIETSKQLDLYKAEWATKIKEVRTGTNAEFNNMVKDMPTIGKSLIQGIKDGLADMAPSLLDQARSIADSVSSTIKGALDYNNNSQLTEDMSKWIPNGVSIGFKAEEKSVKLAMQGLSEKIQTGIRGFGSNNTSTTTNTTNNVDKGVTQNLHFYNNAPLTPSEVARQTKRAGQQAALGWL